MSSFSQNQIRHMEQVGSQGGFINTTGMTAADKAAADAAVIKGQTPQKK